MGNGCVFPAGVEAGPEGSQEQQCPPSGSLVVPAAKAAGLARDSSLTLIHSVFCKSCFEHSLALRVDDELGLACHFLVGVCICLSGRTPTDFVQ